MILEKPLRYCDSDEVTCVKRHSNTAYNYIASIICDSTQWAIIHNVTRGKVITCDLLRP